jgi:hypothetical protein
MIGGEGKEIEAFTADFVDGHRVQWNAFVR